mgnify:CR=1 FL=1
MEISDSVVKVARPGAISRFLRRMRHDPLGLLGLILVAAVVLCGIFGPWITPFDPYKITVPDRFQPPSLTHVFGTDNLGRDIFSRIIAGSRIALSVGISTIAVALAIGLGLGLAAGYGPRWLDNLLMLVFDALYSFPTVILGLTLGVLLGPSMTTLMLVVVLIQTPAYGRLTRTATLSVKSSDYVEAIRSLDQPTRDVFLLRFVEQLSVAEVAETLGEPIGTVKSRLHRGRRQLQEILQITSGLS